MLVKFEKPDTVTCVKTVALPYAINYLINRLPQKKLIKEEILKNQYPSNMLRYAMNSTKRKIRT
jgi:hypothetical protein